MHTGFSPSAPLRVNRTALQDSTLELLFELSERPLQLPLHPSALIPPNQFLTSSRNAIAGRFLVRASRRAPQLASIAPPAAPPVAPKTIPGNKTVFQTLARHALQVGIRQAIGLDRAKIFVRHITARYAFVVGSERHRHSIFHVNRQRMPVAADPKNHIVRSQTNFHEHIFARHFRSSPIGSSSLITS